MRGLILVLLLCAGCAVPKYTGIRIEYQTMRALADVQRQFELETVYCLLGQVRKHVVEVEGIQAAYVAEQTPVSVAFTRCVDMGPVVGWYHNHPYVDGWSACMFSQADLAVFERTGFDVAIVSCSKKDRVAFVVRLRGETEDFVIDDPAFALGDLGDSR